METFLVGLITYSIGYWYGKRVGIARTAIRVQRMIYDLEQIQGYFKNNKQWNEDQL